MTLHTEACDLLRELVRELEGMATAKLLFGPKIRSYELRARGILARAEDLRAIEARTRARMKGSRLSAHPSEHAILEALINARTACAQVGDGDSLAALDTAGELVEAWFKEHAGEEPPRPLPPGPAAGGPFAGQLFDTRSGAHPSDVGGRA